jgi:hypothetical protein
MQNSIKVTMWVAAGVLAVTGVACDLLDDSSAVETLDSSETVQTESALMQSAADAAAPALGVNGGAGAAIAGNALAIQAATKAAETLPGLHTPAGCATAKQDGAKVTVTLTSCSGPYGLADISGSTTHTFSAASASAVTIDSTGDRVTGRGATLSFTAKGALQFGADGTRAMTVSSTGSGTGPRGSAINRTASYTVSWNPETACRTLDGAWVAAGITRQQETKIEALAQCKGECPSAGTITRTFTGTNVTRDVTITFDGSATASYETPRRSGTFALGCGADGEASTTGE